MRRLLIPCLCLFLAGCPSPKPAQPAGKSTPAPQSPPRPEPSASSQNPSASVDYTGVWTTTDEHGQLFDIVIFANGQVVTNLVKGKDGAQGERGFWRREGARLIAAFDDGSTDVISQDGAVYRHQGFAQGAPLTGSPVSTAEIKPVSKPLSDFVGVWRLNKEPDGNYQYLALQSNGRAFSTVNGGTEGTWVVKGETAVCTWPDGWIDVLAKGKTDWEKRSWVGGQTDGPPADVSPAVRVGENRLMAAP